MRRLLVSMSSSKQLSVSWFGGVCVVFAAATFAQTPSGAEVVGAAGAVSPIVVNLDRSLAFYEGILGLKSDALRVASAKQTPRPPILRLEGTPDGTMRWGHVAFPGTMWWAEPLEFGDVERKSVQPRLQDPGAVTVILQVQDIDAIVARMKQAGTPIATPGGLPVMVDAGGTKGRAIIVKDPDDHFVELVQPASLPATPPSNGLISGHVRITIADTDKTMHLYRDLLGFKPQIGSPVSNKGFSALTGLAGAQFRLTTTSVPGEPRLTLEFLEVKGVERKPLRTRIQDPGSTRLQFYVRDLAVAVGHFKSTGGLVVSIDGKPVTGVAPNIPASIIVRDLNNFFIILTERSPKS